MIINEDDRRRQSPLVEGRFSWTGLETGLVTVIYYLLLREWTESHPVSHEREVTQRKGCSHFNTISSRNLCHQIYTRCNPAGEEIASSGNRNPTLHTHPKPQIQFNSVQTSSEPWYYERVILIPAAPLLHGSPYCSNIWTILFILPLFYF